MNPLIAVAVLSLETLDNDKLAAFNNAVQLYGTVPTYNLAYSDVLKLQLIREDGRPVDLESIRTASAFLVNQRVEEGSWK